MKLALFYFIIAIGAAILSTKAYQSIRTHNSESTLRTLLALLNHFPTPIIPENNPLTLQKIELGKDLFYDTRLSADQHLSCSSCHLQEHAFADNRRFSTGVKGDLLRRNTQALFNLAYYPVYTWSNHFLKQLEDQVAIPLFSFDPIELGINDRNREAILKRFKDDIEFSNRFAQAFSDQSEEITFEKISMLLASFLRTLISKNSPYDSYMAGNKNALNSTQKKGLHLFFSKRLGCSQCHSGINFTAAHTDKDTPVSQSNIFVNTGLYNLDEEGSYPEKNQGLYELTLNPIDKGRFRIPSLRNLQYTAPYMHDGSIATLEEVIDHYAQGGREIEGGEFIGKGFLNPNKSPLLADFNISHEEKTALLAFLFALSDEDFLSNVYYSND